MSEAPGEPDSEIVTLRDDQAFVWSQSAASCKSFMFYKDGALGRLRNVAPLYSRDTISTAGSGPDIRINPEYP